jgi:hypothetical protein
MQFKTAFVVHVPDADPEKHSAVLETAVYKLFVKFVKDQQQRKEFSPLFSARVSLIGQLQRYLKQWVMKWVFLLLEEMVQAAKLWRMR